MTAADRRLLAAAVALEQEIIDEQRPRKRLPPPALLEWPAPDDDPVAELRRAEREFAEDLQTCATLEWIRIARELQAGRLPELRPVNQDLAPAIAAVLL